MQNQKVIEINIPTEPDWIQKIKDDVYSNIEKYGNCTQAILSPFLEVFNVDNPHELMATAGSMQGGMLHSLTCGIYTAGMMVLGLLMGRRKIDQGRDALFPIVAPSQILMKRLYQKLGDYSCYELTGVDFTDLNAALEFTQSEGQITCYRRTAECAGEICKLLVELDEKRELFRIE